MLAKELCNCARERNRAALRESHQNPQAARDLQARMIAIDVDGTLLSSRDRVEPNVAAAVRRCADAGILIVTASARPPWALRHIYEELQLNCTQVCFNGGILYDPVHGQWIECAAFTEGHVQRIMQLVVDLDLPLFVSVFASEEWFILDSTSSTRPPLTSSRYREPSLVPSIASIFERGVCPLEINFSGEPQSVDAIATLLEKSMGKEVALHRADLICVSATRHGVDKGTGLRAVANRYKIPLERTIAIGNAPNDISMFRVAGAAYAVANAWSILNMCSCNLVPSNDDGGVAEVLTGVLTHGPRVI